MSDTPRTDAHNWKDGDYDDPLHAFYDFACQLELELNAANERIKRLEEAGDSVMKSLSCGCPHGDSVFHCQTCTNSWDAWRKAKEAKL
tara:strand:- start:534 stop:797 length:264 start_codon:yes stop_codon:yes gene_type:complete